MCISYVYNMYIICILLCISCTLCLHITLCYGVYHVFTLCVMLYHNVCTLYIIRVAHSVCMHCTRTRMYICIIHIMFIYYIIIYVCFTVYIILYYTYIHLILCIYPIFILFYVHIYPI